MPEPDRPVRWAPWWALVLTVVSMILPVTVLSAGIDQIAYGLSDRYMAELAGAVGPPLTALGAVLLLPGLLYLLLRRRGLFVVAMLVGGGTALVALLSQTGVL